MLVKFCRKANQDAVLSEGSRKRYKKRSLIFAYNYDGECFLIGIFFVIKNGRRERIT